jgi:hypothetical protein
MLSHPGQTEEKRGCFIIMRYLLSGRLTMAGKFCFLPALIPVGKSFFSFLLVYIICTEGIHCDNSE